MAKNFGKNKVALVTGGSSGIGKAVCLRLASEGYTVYELSRREADIEGVNHLSCDVTDEACVNDCVDKIISQSGRIDLLVNNAGFGISGAVEFTHLEEAKRLFNVNFFGCVCTVKTVVAHMRSQGGGKIINISSVAAELSIPYQAFYSAAKAAINSLTLAMRNELGMFGIQVCALMPGDVCTGFTEKREKCAAGNELYGGNIERAVCAMEQDEQNGMSPQRLAAKVFSIAKKGKVKPFYTCGAKYKLFLFLAKILPRRFSNFVVGKLYS